MPETFASSDVPSPQDLAAAQKAQQDPATRASDALATSPSLARDPTAAKSFLSQPVGNGRAVGQAANFTEAYGKLHNGIKVAAQSDNPHAGGWLSDLWHGVASTWDAVAKQVTPGAIVNDLNPFYRPPGQANRDKAFLTSAEDLGKAGIAGAKGLGKMATELGSFGQVNPSDLSNNNPNLGKNYSEGVHTVVNGLNNTVNPFTVYKNMGHTIAFTESLARRKGWGVALSTMMPYFIAAMATHTALVGEGLSSAEAASAFKTVATEAEASGAVLTPEEAAALKASEAPAELPQTVALGDKTTTSIPFEQRTAQAEHGTIPPEAPVPPTGRGPVFNVASKIVGTVTKPLSAVTKIARILGAPTRDVTLNSMYALAHAGISQNTELAPLWNATLNGPVDENGHPMGSVGSNIVGYLGLPAGGFANALAASINIYTNYLGSDPLGAIGKVVGATRTFDGTGGVIGRMFGGLGIRTPEDVTRISDQYIRVRRAFSWMANHSAGEINDNFRGMFVGPGSKEVLRLLGDAKTPEAVQKVFADMSQGINYLHNTAPTMSFYQLTKASFKYGDRMFSVGDSLAGSIDQLHAEAADIQKQTGFKVWPPDSANYAVGEGPIAAQVRARTVMAQRFSEAFRETQAKYEAGAQNALGNFGRRMFTNKESYFNESTRKLENYMMDAGSTQLSNAVGDQLRALGMDHATIATAQNAMVNATPEEMNHLVKNIYHDAIMQRFYASTKYSVLDQVKTQVSNDLKTFLDATMGNDGAGEKGIMVNGPLGEQFTWVPGEDALSGKNAGIGETHLGVLHFPRVRDLQGYAKFVGRIADEFSHAQDGMMGIDDHLAADALERKAAFANATLRGLAKSIAEKSGTYNGLHDLASFSKEAFDTKIAELHQEVSRALGEVSKGDTIGHNQAFVSTFMKVRQNTGDVQKLVKLAEEWNAGSRDVVVGSDTYNRLLQEVNANLPQGTIADIRSLSTVDQARLDGELSALKEASAQMKARLQKNAITVKQLMDHVEGRNPGLSPEAKDSLVSKLQNLRESNPRYRNKWQYFVDGVNYYNAHFWSRLALFSGGWAVRVGNSEMLLNSFKEGGMQMFQAKLLTSYIKHETGRTAVTSKLEDFASRHFSLNLFKGSMGDMVKRTDLTIPQKLMSSTVRTVGGLILGMRDAAGGTLHGLEGNLINWTPRTERMFDRVMGAVQDYAPGGLPGGVHGAGGIMADEVMQQHLLLGEDENGKSIASSVNQNRTFASVNAGDKNYYRGLRSSMTRIHDDKFLSSTMNTLHEILPTLPKVMDSEDVNHLIERLTQSGLDTIQAQPAGDLARFVRDSAKGKMALPDSQVYSMLSDAQKASVDAMTAEEKQTFYAHYDWARTIAYHDVHTVLGNVGNDQFIIHGSLVRQTATGEIKPLADLRKEIDAMPTKTEPQNIVAETHATSSAQTMTQKFARAFDIPSEIADKGFHAVLGPMVNSYVRDSVYLMNYDREMENLQHLVDKNLISEDVQKITSHTNASIKMSRFVHNPQERTLFESNMRAFAPFYFAQNQAWRRALRVASDDPGAFEKYLRASLMMTNYVSAQNKSGNPIHIPASEFMGAVAGMGSGLAPDQLGSMGFSLAGSVSSISSVVPTGSAAGLGVLENIIRPSWGFAATLPLRGIEHFLGVDHQEWANKTTQAILGPLGASSSVMNELIPSSITRNVFNLEQGITHANNPSFNTAMLYAYNNAVDNLSKKFYYKAYNELTQAKIPASMAASLARAYAEKQVPEFLNIKTNTRQVQQFVDQIHAAAVAMYAVKTALGFFSPVALSLQATFSKEPEFQKLLNEKKPDGTPKYDFATAMTIYASEYPNHIVDLVAHSVSNGSSYPETTATLNLIQNYPYAISHYKNAAAYLTPHAGAFNSTTYQDELAMQLRSRYKNFDGGNSGLGDYMDAVLYAIGNDYYYNHLKPQFPEAAGNAGYDNYKNLTAAAKQYGLNTNPTWYAQFSSGNAKYTVESQAVQQMDTMLQDPNVPVGAYGSANNKAMYEVVMGIYNKAVTQYNDATSKTEKYNIETNWYTNFTNMAADTTAVSPALSYFITNVLRHLPTATR